MSANLKTITSATAGALLSQQLSTSEAALYTVPAATTVKIAQGSLCNTTGSDTTVFLSIVKSGGTMGDGTHRVISGATIKANDTISLDYLAGHFLGPGDVIAGYAGAATAVDIVVSGVVLT
ncbi:hypothetical protein [Arthrobacter sp. efr-133-TYG-118]|uniref:hypothetical protein n=1 Tax=Arthrobacter sp. efr-133-TYG-118 TaxID=3040279 RepID=UPI0025512072|nr:hypothetical protein [Arthrobacter sp. efr-133-TYG-118]